MSQPFKLFRLQQIDSQLDRARSKLKEIDTRLMQNEELLQVQNYANEAEQKLHVEQKRLKKAEEEVQSQRIKIEQTESTLYGGKVKNPKELKDLENEAVALKKYLIVLEDRLLEAMLSVDEAISTYTQSQNALNNIMIKVTERNKKLEEEKGNISSDIERLDKDRAVAVTSIASQDLILYEQLRIKRHGVAVAQVIEQTCSGCGSTLNASLLQSAISMNQIICCDSCGRILYGGK
jgi:predicted  nucleic acid-binding Zn-ribbon protein